MWAFLINISYNSEMKTLVVDGVEYTKASEAAKTNGYTTDYVGQLCRAGKVDAQLVGRSWYVNVETLLTHRKGRYRSTQKKTTEAIHIAKEEIVAKQVTEADQKPHYYNRLNVPSSISYESEDSELLPTPKKVVVEERTEEQPVEQEIKIIEATEEPGEYFVDVKAFHKPTQGSIVISEEVEHTPEEEASKRSVAPQKTTVQSEAVPRHIHQSLIPPKQKIQVQRHTPVVPMVRPVSTPAVRPKVLVPILVSVVTGLIVAGALVSVSWQFSTSELGDSAGYKLNLSAVKSSEYVDK